MQMTAKFDESVSAINEYIRTMDARTGDKTRVEIWGDSEQTIISGEQQQVMLVIGEVANNGSGSLISAKLGV